MPHTPHKPHHHVPTVDDEPEPGLPPVDPDDGIVPPLGPHGAESDQPTDPAT